MSESSPVVSRADLAERNVLYRVGSSLLTNLETGLEREKIQSYRGEIAQLMSLGKEVILVSSGSIAEVVSAQAGVADQWKCTGYRRLPPLVRLA